VLILALNEAAGEYPGLGIVAETLRAAGYDLCDGEVTAAMRMIFSNDRKGRICRPARMPVGGLFGLVKVFSLAAVIFVTASGAEEPIRQDSLFRIERSKNANIVQYDARVGPDGKLLAEKAVVAYWIRLAEQGQVKELSWLQRTFAYGFDIRLGPDRESATLKMAADFGHPITVQRDGDDYRALMQIDGEPAWLERIFVQTSNQGLSKNIDFVELFGTALADGSPRRERLTP
jgi:hypothetical protein